jgi:signal transduction histidine kinase
VLTRHLAVKLLAPTVLVSLLLVAACVAAAVHLRRLQVDVSGVLSEHIDSTLAGANLQTGVRSLIDKLRDQRDHRDDADSTTKQIDELNGRVEEQLFQARRLANLEHEQELVARCDAGWDAYRRDWALRSALPPKEWADRDGALADGLQKSGVLDGAVQLRDFNMGQVAAADQANRAVVNTLTWGLLVVGVAAPLCGLALGYAVARSLHQSMYQLSVRIRDAAGRLKSELHPVTLEAPRDLQDLHHQMHGVIDEIEQAVARLQQREREVLRAEQLAAVGQVAAGVAHELRNPLTSVKMLVQTGLEGAAPGGLPPDDLAIIERELHRMEACIQTFLDYARPPQSERRRSDLLTVVRRGLSLVEARARRQKVTVEADLPPGPLELDIDAEQVHQVVVNLLLNALDALPKGGVVQVTVRGPTVQTPAATVEVRDDGPGLDPRIRPRLFEPFASTKETGLGLGLSICRRLVEAHGGAIRGGDADGGGATFSFTLPDGAAVPSGPRWEL